MKNVILKLNGIVTGCCLCIGWMYLMAVLLYKITFILCIRKQMIKDKLGEKLSRKERWSPQWSASNAYWDSHCCWIPRSTTIRYYLSFFLFFFYNFMYKTEENYLKNKTRFSFFPFLCFPVGGALSHLLSLSRGKESVCVCVTTQSSVPRNPERK